MYTCPVLDYKAVRGWVQMFRACYALQPFGMSLRYQRVMLPYEGGVMDQPAKEMEVLEYIEFVANDILTEQMKRYRERSRDRHKDIGEESYG